MTEVQHLPTLSSVILLRVRDYVRRPVAEQARLTAQLETLLALLLPDMPANRRVVMEGAGTAVVAVLADPPAALALAQRALRAHEAGLTLNIGIDHGPVELVSSDGAEVLAGDGVATASVLAAFATEVGLLVSRSFRTALAQSKPGAQHALVSAGDLSDAGLRSYRAFRVDRDAPRRRRRRYTLVAVCTAVLLLGAALALRLGVPERPRPLAPYLDKLEVQMSARPTRSARERH